MAERYRVPYITLTPTFSICKTHGYVDGEKPVCPSCGGECLVYSRIVGYFRPTRDWNRGKRAEFKQRKTYRLSSPPESYYSSDSGISIQKEPDGRHESKSGKEILPVIDLPIAGFTKLALSDWPGKVQASIMFTSRCNLSCGWCHNGDVVNGSAERESTTSADHVLRYVLSTTHQCLVISGGEPTIHNGLLPFLRLCRDRGVSVKLDSNGTNPGILRQAFDERLVDFVAMDIKAKPENYKKVAGKAVRPDSLRESIEMIKASGVAHQFRTTVVPDFIDIEDVLSAKCLAGRSGLQLQRFRKGKTNLRRKFKEWREHSDEEWANVTARVEESGEIFSDNTKELDLDDLTSSTPGAFPGAYA